MKSEEFIVRSKKRRNLLWVLFQSNTTKGRRSIIHRLRDISGRLSQLSLAAFLGNHYLYEVRDTTSGPIKLFVTILVFMLVGLATS